MSAFILDYLDKLNIIKKYPTWILAECPVCGGTLKISVGGVKNGAYACYTNECHKHQDNLIRKKLYNPNSPFNTKKYISPFQSKSLINVVKTIDIDSTLKPINFLTIQKFIKPKQSRENDTITTYFDYLDFHVVRVDDKDSKGNKIKYFYPLQSNGVKEIPSSFNNLPVYRLSYIQPDILFVEGEKCATIAQYLGLSAITFPAFLFAERYLDRSCAKLAELGVKNVLYLRDNDTPGEHKANSVSNYLSNNQIGNKIVNVADLYPQFKDIKGFDLYDLYKQKILTTSTKLNFLDKCLQ